MWKYIVTWYVAFWVSTPCPDKFEEEEFGKNPIYYSCNVMHGIFEHDLKEKVFFDFKEAHLFYEKCKSNEAKWITYTALDQLESVARFDSVQLISHGSITNVKLDSINQ